MKPYILPAALLLSFVSASLCAQARTSPAPQAARGTGTLDVVVRQGEAGKAVTGLAEGSFTLLENGKAQPITSFHVVEGAASTTRVLLVVDAVNLDFTRLGFERDQLVKFLHSNDGQLAQPTSLAIFTDTGLKTMPEYTRDGNALAALFQKQVIGLRDIHRSAGFYGATERLELSVRALSVVLNRFGQEPGRKLVVWLTPGWPLIASPAVDLTGSQLTGVFNQVVSLSDAFRRTQTTMYVVDPIGASRSPARSFYYEAFLGGPKNANDAQLADLGAQVLAVNSGGQYLTGSNDLVAQLDTCYHDAGAYYRLTFEPTSSANGDSYHRLQVKVNSPGLAVRSERAYYSPASPAASR